MAAKRSSCIVPNCKNPTVAPVGRKYFRESVLYEEWMTAAGVTEETVRAAGDEEEMVCKTHRPDDGSWGFLSAQHDLVQDHSKILEESYVLSCRLCMKEVKDDAFINIFNTMEAGMPLANVITCCIQPLKISQQDKLSKIICEKCHETIKTYHSFRNTCIKFDKIQCGLIGSNERAKRKSETEHSGGRTVKRISSDGSVTVTTGYDLKKEQMANAELLKVLEDRLPEDMKSADNIIIEVRSDDEEADAGSCSTASLIDDDKNGRTSVNVIRISRSGEKVTLPKGIHVNSTSGVERAPHKVPQSKTGLVDAKVIQGMCDLTFVMADGYLFELGLVKDNARRLKCAAPKCPTIAHQNCLEPGMFDNKIAVKSLHNHFPPSARDIKLQMCLHVMRQRMNNDKTLNFRSVFDRLCDEDPELQRLVPIKSVVSEICSTHVHGRMPVFKSFVQFYDAIEGDSCRKLQFTHSHQQFYQERFNASDGSMAVIFANVATIERVSGSKIMYVDSSFKIGSREDFGYHLVTILVWTDESFYPILFALVDEKTREIYKTIFSYLRDTLAPDLRPEEIVTDYEASLYYALSETYLESRIGGSVFYYTQNLYKKICSLDLSRDLETNSSFRNIYHMILMLPLLPVNTIHDGLNNVELQAAELGLTESMRPIFDYVKAQWISKVTPDFFCVHGLENRINENVVAPFKKLRDFLMLSKGKMAKQHVNVALVVEKLIELEAFLQAIYSAPSKKSFARDLSSTQKRNVIRAWQFIESHPKININNFFSKVLGYIKCMENQLWIWGFYRYAGDAGDDLINADNFSIVNSKDSAEEEASKELENVPEPHDVVMDVVIENEGFLVDDGDVKVSTGDGEYQDVFLNYVQKD